MFYIDTSILVAYYCPEAISQKVEQFLINIQNPTISLLTQVEITSAISMKIRQKEINPTDGKNVLSLFEKHLDDKSFSVLPVQPKHFKKASTLISRFNTTLRTLDALHLAISSNNHLPIVTADKNLALAAKSLDIQVVFMN